MSAHVVRFVLAGAAKHTNCAVCLSVGRALGGLRLAIRICMHLWCLVLHSGAGGRVDERGTRIGGFGARLSMALVFT